MKYNLKNALIWLATASGSLAVLGVLVFPIFGSVGMTVLSVIVLLVCAFVIGGLIDENP